MSRRTGILMAVVGLLGSSAVAQEAPTTGVKTLAPAGAIKPTGTWGWRPAPVISCSLPACAASIRQPTLSSAATKPESGKRLST
jgi:hypothetical protein